MPFTDKELEIRFTYHPPKERQPLKYETIRLKAHNLSIVINELCPDCYEKDEAIKAVESAVMWANAGIARREE